MNVLFRYIGREILLASLLVLIALASLFLIFDFSRELGEVGRAGNTLPRMLLFVALAQPANIYVVFPLALLMGTLFALSRLSVQSELAVMRASGLSLLKLAGVVTTMGVGYAMVLFAFGEYVVPHAEDMGKRLRLQATQSVVAQEFRSGFWVKDERSFVNIQSVTADTELVGIRIYAFDEAYRLVESSLAQKARFTAEGKWELVGLQRTLFTSQGTKIETAATAEWKSLLTPDLLAALKVKPSEMSLGNLSAYIDHLRENKQKSTQYELALWYKIVRPLALVALMLIAIPFALQSARSAGMGARLLLGIVIGVGFHFLGQLSGHLALLNDWSALFTTLLPPLLVLGVALLSLNLQDRPRLKWSS